MASGKKIKELCARASADAERAGGKGILNSVTLVWVAAVLLVAAARAHLQLPTQGRECN
jgi:hypothetical protein